MYLTALDTSLISINGPTSSGKTKLSLELAKNLEGCWVVNCDSRQIYERLTIGTGKEPGEWRKDKTFGKVYYIEEIPHLLIDYINPNKRYTLVDYILDFKNIFNSIEPSFCILVGGTGLYHDTITNKNSISQTKREYSEEFLNAKAKLSKLTLIELQNKVEEKKINLNSSDYRNPRRLVNKLLEKQAQENNWLENIKIPKFKRVIKTHANIDQLQLKQNISKRLEDRFRNGLIAETESIQDLGTGRILELGLEYRLTQLYLLGHYNYEEYKKALLRENLKLAKRQMTWIRKSGSIGVQKPQDILDIL